MFWIWSYSALGYAAMLAWQLYGYLRRGWWPAYSTTDACYDWLKVDWCVNPHDWLGVHSALAQTNPAGLVLLVSTAALWLVASIDEANQR